MLSAERSPTPGRLSRGFSTVLGERARLRLPGYPRGTGGGPSTRGHRPTPRRCGRQHMGAPGPFGLHIRRDPGSPLHTAVSAEFTSRTRYRIIGLRSLCPLDGATWNGKARPILRLPAARLRGLSPRRHRQSTRAPRRDCSSVGKLFCPPLSRSFPGAGLTRAPLPHGGFHGSVSCLWLVAAVLPWRPRGVGRAARRRRASGARCLPLVVRRAGGCLGADDRDLDGSVERAAAVVRRAGIGAQGR